MNFVPWPGRFSVARELPDFEDGPPKRGTRSFDPDALLSTFAPNGDIIAVRKDNSIARYCRSP